MRGRLPASVWVGPTRVDDRIDTRPYKPWVLARIDRCTSFGGGTIRLGDPGVCSQLSRGVGGGKPSEQAVAVYKAKEVTGYGFAEPEIFLSDCTPPKLLQDGDVVLTSSGIGTIGRADLFDHRSFPKGVRCTVDNHVTIIRTSTDSLLPEFLVAFLNSAYGKAWSEWGTTGSTRLLELSPSKVRRFEVPRADTRIQEYIAARIRLARECGAASTALRRRAAAELASLWKWDAAPTHRQDGSSVRAHIVSTLRIDDRLDAQFYEPWHLELESWLDEHECWPLGDLVSSPVKGVQPEYDSEGTIPALTVTHVDPFLLDRSGATGFVSEAWVKKNPRARVEAGDLLCTVTGPPLGETVVVEQSHLPAAINSHVARVQVRSNFPYRHLAAGILNSPLGQWQTTRYSKGIRQKELYPKDFMRFRFPVLPPRDARRLDRLYSNACSLAERARTLVDEAKADVEALLEGRLETGAIISGRVKAPSSRNVSELAEEIE
ncbi:hypothetical protein [Corallococcus sp. AB011P]|uniref:hypothetical protein n=1 Tax=Corallococcus sp. AB011P TaxID=2316735 RepID=UPI0011C3D03B|nr:hypothetical protein [Corallococcus sp. AB011P]